jgi:hypothetical protein
MNVGASGKLSATLDQALLNDVDAYLRDRPDRDLETVVDEALRIWLDVARAQDRAMEEQYAAPDDIPEDELRQRSSVLKANARVMLRPAPDCSGSCPRLIRMRVSRVAQLCLGR